MSHDDFFKPFVIDATCAKCGSYDVKKEFMRYLGRECLKHSCGTCKNIWFTNTRDYKPTEEPTK